MNKAEQERRERLEHLEQFEQDQEEKARRFREENSGGELNEGMRDLARLLGLPEDMETLQREFQRRRLRRRIRITSLCWVSVTLVALCAAVIANFWL